MIGIRLTQLIDAEDPTQAQSELAVVLWSGQVGLDTESVRVSGRMQGPGWCASGIPTRVMSTPAGWCGLLWAGRPQMPDLRSNPA